MGPHGTNSSSLLSSLPLPPSLLLPSNTQIEKHSQRIPISQRGGEVIEPLVSTQWFVKMDHMAKRALDVVETKELKILPERFEKIW